MNKIFRYLLVVAAYALLPVQVAALVGPVILEQPAPVLAREGESARFGVHALGLGLRFQWFKNSTPIIGANQATLQIADVAAADAGSYHVLVSSTLGSTRSRSAELALYRSIQIASQPASQSVNPGAAVTFTVQATGTPAPSFQWTLNGENIPGANGPALSIASVSPADGGRYQVLVFTDDEVVNSQAAFLEVAAPLLPFGDALAARGEIVGRSGVGRGSNSAATREHNEPYGGGVNAHKSVWLKWVAPETGYVTFSTAGSSFDTLLAAFRVSGTAFEPLASDDDSSDYHTSLVQFNVESGTEYAILVDGEDGSSGSIVLGWNMTVGRKMPLILSQPLSQTLNLAQLIPLELLVDYDGSYEVQWFRNGEPIPSLLGPVLDLASILGLPIGVYCARITTEHNEVFYTSDAEVQINTEGLKAGSRNKLSQALATGIRPPGGLSAFGVGRIRAFSSISGAAGYSGAQYFQTMPGRDPDEPNHCGVMGGASYWLSYTAPATGLLSLNTDGSSFDTLLAVYASTGGSGYSSLYSIACDNNSGADRQDSRVVLNVTAGHTCYIVVDGVNGAYGRAVLNYSLNQNPAISSLASVTISEDSSGPSRSFTISDKETAEGSLVVWAATSNPSLIPAGNIFLGGSGSQRTVSFRPAANAAGHATITLTVQDPHGGRSSTSFAVSVTPVNDAPVASSDTVPRNSRYGTVSIYIPGLLANDYDADADTLSLYSYSGCSKGGTLSRNGNYLVYAPASSYQTGDSFSYSVSDGKGGFSSATVTLQ